MIRFPNPVSDIINLRGLFTKAVIPANEASSGTGFTHDDVGNIATKTGLVSSRGRIGEEAAKRSFNKKRSLDPVFNQVKMLTELYRLLGWIIPTPESRGHFIVTPIGKQISEFKGDKFDSIKTEHGSINEREVLEWNLLNICFPHPHTDVKSNQKVRPFALMLRYAESVGGFFTRDELALTALQIIDDRDYKAIKECADMVYSWRSGLEDIAEYRNYIVGKLGISYNTMGNYTRFPLGSIRGIEWFKPLSFNELPSDIKEMYRKQLGKRFSKIVVYCMTGDGQRVLDLINNYVDIRFEDLKDYPGKSLEKLLILLYLIRNRSPIKSDQIPYFHDAVEIIKKFVKYELKPGINNYPAFLFEPFQQMPSEIIIKAMR